MVNPVVTRMAYKDSRMKYPDKSARKICETWPSAPDFRSIKRAGKYPARPVAIIKSTLKIMISGNNMFVNWRTPEFGFK